MTGIRTKVSFLCGPHRSRSTVIAIIFFSMCSQAVSLSFFSKSPVPSTEYKIYTPFSRPSHPYPFPYHLYQMAQQPQSLYYNAPYPPIMLPSIQYPQTAASPTFSQFTSDSDSNSPTPSPVEYSPSSAHSQETPASYIFNASDQTNHYATLHHQALSPPPYSSPYSTFPLPTLGNPGPRLDSKSQSRPAEKSATAKKIQIAHPYARIFAKKDEIKRRKIWNHALEKSIFTPYELWVYLINDWLCFIGLTPLVSFFSDQPSVRPIGGPFTFPA